LKKDPLALQVKDNSDTVLTPDNCQYKKKKIPVSGYLRFNLNLIVDRPDGLIKEGKKSLSSGSI